MVVEEVMRKNGFVNLKKQLMIGKKKISFKLKKGLLVGS